MTQGAWCWWCCHEFEGQSLHLPFKWDSLRNRFETMGCERNVKHFATGGQATSGRARLKAANCHLTAGASVRGGA